MVHSEEEISEAMLTALREMAGELGRTPYAHEMEDVGPYSAATYQRRFGSWNEAVEQCSLKRNRVWGGAMVECWHCGTEFRKKYSHAKHHKRHFCDDECMGSWESEHYTGEGNPRWSGGYSEYYGKNWEQARRERLTQDEYECQSCRMGQQEHRELRGQTLHVHHITPVREFEEPEEANEQENLVTLCYLCHKKWEGLPFRPDTGRTP